MSRSDQQEERPDRRDVPPGGGLPHPPDYPGGRKDEQREMSAWHRLTGIGIEFIVAICLFGGLGWYLDSKLGTMPWLLLIGFGLGFALGLYMMVRAARRLFHD